MSGGKKDGNKAVELCYIVNMCGYVMVLSQGTGTLGISVISLLNKGKCPIEQFY